MVFLLRLVLCLLIFVSGMAHPGTDSHHSTAHFLRGWMEGRIHQNSDYSLTLGDGEGLPIEAKTYLIPSSPPPQAVGPISDLPQFTQAWKSFLHIPTDRMDRKQAVYQWNQNHWEKVGTLPECEIKDYCWYDGTLHLLMQPARSAPTSVQLYRLKTTPTGQFGALELAGMAPLGVIYERMVPVENRLFVVGRKAGDPLCHLYELRNTRDDVAGWYNYGEVPLPGNDWTLDQSGDHILVYSKQTRGVCHTHKPAPGKTTQWKNEKITTPSFEDGYHQLIADLGNQEDSSAILVNEFKLPRSSQLLSLQILGQGKDTPYLRYRIAGEENSFYTDWTSSIDQSVIPIDQNAAILQYEIHHTADHRPYELHEIRLVWLDQDKQDDKPILAETSNEVYDFAPTSDPNLPNGSSRNPAGRQQPDQGGASSSNSGEGQPDESPKQTTSESNENNRQENAPEPGHGEINSLDMKAGNPPENLQESGSAWSDDSSQAVGESKCSQESPQPVPPPMPSSSMEKSVHPQDKNNIDNYPSQPNSSQQVSEGTPDPSSPVTPADPQVLSPLPSSTQKEPATNDSDVSGSSQYDREESPPTDPTYQDLESIAEDFAASHLIPSEPEQDLAAAASSTQKINDPVSFPKWKYGLIPILLSLLYYLLHHYKTHFLLYPLLIPSGRKWEEERKKECEKENKYSHQQLSSQNKTRVMPGLIHLKTHLPAQAAGQIEWCLVEPLPVPMPHASATYHQGKVYVLSPLGYLCCSQIRSDGSLCPWSIQTCNLPFQTTQGMVGFTEKVAVCLSARHLWIAALENGKIGNWKDCGSLADVNDQVQMVTTAERLYLIGGQGASGALPLVRSFHVNQQRLDDFQIHSPLPLPLVNTRLLASKKYLFALGGQLGNKAVNKVFSMSLDINDSSRLWEEEVSLPFPLLHPFGHIWKERIWFAGGIEGKKKNLSVVGVLGADGHIEEWKLVPNNLKESIRDGAMLLAAGRFFLLGGWQGGILGKPLREVYSWYPLSGFHQLI